MFTPNLAICLYHSVEDFVTIPQYLNSLGLGYKFYIDHATIHWEETVLFCIHDPITEARSLRANVAALRLQLTQLTQALAVHPEVAAAFPYLAERNVPSSGPFVFARSNSKKKKRARLFRGLRRVVSGRSEVRLKEVLKIFRHHGFLGLKRALREIGS